MIFKSTLTLLLLAIIGITANAQARLTVVNKSARVMTVKLMKGYNDRGTLKETVNINAYESRLIYFSEGGTYFTKTKAIIAGKEPMYRRGQSFQVTNDSDGYSILTLTFVIKESIIPQASGGKQISKTEFDQN